MANLRQTPLTCSGHTRPVVHLDFSEITESSYFLISACKGKHELWKHFNLLGDTNNTLAQIFRPPVDPIKKSTFDSNGKPLITIKDGKPMLRQGDTGDWIGTFEGHKGAVWGVALNADATKAASGAADFSAKLWDAITGEELHSFQHNHIVKSVNFSRDSALLATASNEKLIRLFDLNKPEATPEVFSGHTAGIRHILFFRNDTHLVSCADDKTLRVWDRSNKQEIHKVSFPFSPNSLEVSKDGSVLTVTYSNKVAFYDAETLNKIREYTIPSPVNSASLHPDKSIFVAGGDDLKVYKYDYQNGTEIESFKGHFGPIHCIKFSPDGELYASGSEDGTLRLWQTTIGKTYGLWKCTETANLNESLTPKEVQAN